MIASVRLRIRASILCFCLLISIAPITTLNLHGQPSNTTTQTFRTLSVVCSYGGLFYELNGRSKPVKVSLDQGFSPDYIRPHGTTLEIFREYPVPENSPPGTKPIRKVAITAKLPEKALHCIVITSPQSPSAKFTDPLLSRVFVDDSKEHHAKTLNMVNFTSFPAVIMINNTQYSLAIGENTIVSWPQDATSMTIQVAVQKNGTWKPTYKSEFSTNAALRGYMFMFDYIDDPEYTAAIIPVPALVKTIFEISPEITSTITRPAPK